MQQEQQIGGQQQNVQTAPNGIAGGSQQMNQMMIPGGAVSPASGTTAMTNNRPQVNGGRFDFDDGGTYCGGWEDGKAHGHGVCTGPKGQGAYSGSWHYGFEVSGVYTWPSGSAYEGQWQNGKRHGLGMETRGRWLYRGEWTQGFKGRYGVRQSTTSTARYEGTWASGLQDGYGSETYADSGTYQGQWLRGMRHGYGVRTSAPFGLASHYKPPKQQIRASLTSLRSTDAAPGSTTAAAPTPEPTDKRDRRVDDNRGGFVLKARSDDPPARRKSLTEKSLKKGILSGLKIRKQRSTGDLEKKGTSGSIRSNASSASWMSTESSQSQASASVHTDSNASFVIEDEQMDASVTETYLGEWKNDKRTGFGISERSDGLRYEGEWFNNRKYGYGVTTFRDGSKEEGKYKNNVLITSQKKKHIFLIRSAKFRDRIENAVSAANRSSKMALQKADIAISRTATARGKAELADIAADHARQDSDLAQATARQFAPDFRQPGLERLRNREIPKYIPPSQDAVPGKSILQKSNNNNNNNINNNINTTNQLKTNTGINDTTIITTTTTSGGGGGGSNLIGTNTTPQSISQSVNQSIRRASMKSPQNSFINQITNVTTGQNNNGQQQNNYQLQNNLQSNQYGVYNSSVGAGASVNEQFIGGIIGGANSSINNNNNNNSSVIGGNLTGTSVYHGQNIDSANYSGYNNQGISQGYNQYQQQSYSTLQQQPQSQNIYDPTLSSNNQYSTNAYSGQSSAIPNQYDSGQNMYGTQMYQQQNQQQQQHQQQQQQQQQQYSDGYSQSEAQRHPSVCIRRNSRILGQQDRPPVIGQTLNDRLDHYKRPPSRDSSVDRYRVPGRLIGSRQPSVDKSMNSQDAVDRSGRGASLMRSGTPLNGSAIGSGAATPVYTPPTSTQFEGALRNRGMGQEIIPSASQPKRTESLYVAPARGAPSGAGGAGSGGGGIKAMPVTSMPLQRKKSLPDVAGPIQLTATSPLSREEVSFLSSMRREEIRRQIDERERLRANPFLYLVSPQVKDWFSRQQLVMLVLFINISLALMFFKLLT